MAVNPGRLPFAEALAFFKDKLSLPTQKWDDLLGSAHDRAFVVAGVMLADLLTDLRAAVDRAITDGQTLDSFRQDFSKIITDRGWLQDKTKGYLAWRSRVIFETNLFTSYAAGRYQQLKDVADARPYWRYRHSDASVVPRPAHLAWDGTILRHDDPWWSGRYPPGGWLCKCYVESLSEREMKKSGLAVTPAADIPYNGTVTVVDKKTGEVTTLPEGVDRGWDYAPGASVAAPLAGLLKDKAAVWPPELTAAVAAFLKPVLSAETWAAIANALGIAE